MEVNHITVESRALEAALAVVEGQGNPAQASASIEALLSLWTPDDSPGDYVKLAAFRRIVGDSLVGPGWLPSSSGPEDQRIFELTAHAWVTWASGGTEPFESQIDSPPSGGEGLIHRMALGYWAVAVENLTKKDLPEARRLFRRATELGGQFGTETNPVVLWTYAASFWTPRPSS